MADHPPRSGRPASPSEPSSDRPTDPGLGGYGPLPDGWDRDRGHHRRRAGLVLVLTGVVLATLVVLLWLLVDDDDSDGSGDGGEPPSAGLPEPTLDLERGGFRYSIGVGPFTPAAEAPGRGPVPPGRVVLVATVVVRNDTDRPAPSLIDSQGAAPRLRVGLGGVTTLPPTRSLGLPRQVSDCLNDPRNPRVSSAPDPVYQGLAAPTCIVEATTRPARPTPTGISDRTLAPGGVNEGLIVTIELPASVPTDQVSAWLPDTTTAADGATVFIRLL